jgi:hypothetical protein
MRIRGPRRGIIVLGAAIALAVLCGTYWPKAGPDVKAIATAEDEVYEAVIRDMYARVPERGSTQLVFSDTVLTESGAGLAESSCRKKYEKDPGLNEHAPPQFNTVADKLYRWLHREPEGSLRADTVRDFASKACIGGKLSTAFHTDFPKAFVADDAKIYFDVRPIERDGWIPFQQAFPGATGIMAFSHVGFDSTMDEAMVSASFVCGWMCGSGGRTVLKKRHGKWEVVAGWITWIS